MFEEGVEGIVHWLEAQCTSSSLVTLIEQYLLARGRSSLTSLLPIGSPFKTLARIHDRLGWDCFLEGRICSLWVHARDQDIACTTLRFDADFWGRGLIRQLQQLTHRQWVYRNMVVHSNVGGNLSAKQHDQLVERVDALLMMDPHELLPEHRVLLEMDFEKVGSGSVVDLQLWEAEMNAAVGAVEHIRRRSQHALRTRYCVGPNPRMATVEESVFIDNEGSIKWKRRRRRK